MSATPEILPLADRIAFVVEAIAEKTLDAIPEGEHANAMLQAVVERLIATMPRAQRRLCVRTLAEKVLREVNTGDKPDGLLFGSPHGR
jgi:hypothetical protein